MERRRELATVDLAIPADAFSHGQIKSKLWLAEQLAGWASAHLDASKHYELNWYGCWVGLGPFFLLRGSGIRFSNVNLFDLDRSSLASAEKILNYWHCEGAQIQQFCTDINDVKPKALTHQLFVNTSCEHMDRDSWLRNIPPEAWILLQSTDMKHAEHISSPDSLQTFVSQQEPFIRVLESAELKFSYPDKKFSRYMLFGKKL
jgi:hypothetical protein